MGRLIAGTGMLRPKMPFRLSTKNPVYLNTPKIARFTATAAVMIHLLGIFSISSAKA